MLLSWPRKEKEEVWDLVKCLLFVLGTTMCDRPIMHMFGQDYEFPKYERIPVVLRVIFLKQRGVRVSAGNPRLVQPEKNEDIRSSI